jgi:uncharacterized protein YegJ (DUF2314 family)
MYKISLENIGDVKKYVWHYRKDNKEYGPFTYEDIVEMVKKGEIGPEDYLLKFGNRKFFKASEVQGLFDESAEHEAKPEKAAETAEAPEGPAAIAKEEHKEDHRVVFDNRTAYYHTKRKQEATNRIIMIGAGLLGLGLAVWAILSFL